MSLGVSELVREEVDKRQKRQDVQGLFAKANGKVLIIKTFHVDVFELS